MATDAKLRKLVERLLRREFHPQHLTDIFLALRFRSFGVATVAEIGHFVAHSDERTHGLITDEAKDVFRFFKASMPYWWDKKLDWSDLPSNTAYFMLTNFRRLSSEKIKSNTGLSQKQAQALLNQNLRKFTTKPNGRQSFAGCSTQVESDLLGYVYRTVVIRPLFKTNELFRDFLFVLSKNRLLADHERSGLKYLRSPLSLYAIERMNQSELVLEDGWHAHLDCSLLSDATGDRLLGVSAKVAFSPDLKGIAGFVTPVFSTDLVADDWCSGDLLKALDSTFPNVEIELTPEPKLVLI